MRSFSAIRLVATLACVGELVTCGPSTSAAGGIQARTDKPDSPYDPNSTKYCTYWWNTEGSYTCEEVVTAWDIAIQDFVRWNPSITASCGNFKVRDASYCVEAIGEPGHPQPTGGTPTSTSTGPVPTTTVIEGTSYPLPPAPTVTGTTPKCKSWYVIANGDSCDTIATKNNVGKSQINLWNNYINIACDNIWLGNAVCVSSPLEISFWHSIGCYTDSTSRALAKQIVLPDQNTKMTPRLCQDACRAAGYSYAGIEYAHQCWCDNSIKNGNAPAASGCTAKCPGDTTLSCGGDNRLNVYRTDKYLDLGCYNDKSTSRTLQTQIAVPNQNSILTRAICQQTCEVANYIYSGVEYAHQCFCDNAIRGTTATSGCTMPCAGNTSEMCGGSDRINVMQKPQSRSVGCYTDTVSARTLRYRAPIVDPKTTMTPDVCRTYCRANGFVYSGVEYGMQCFCDDEINGGAPASSGCNMACGGDAKQMCGGSDRISIYSL